MSKFRVEVDRTERFCFYIEAENEDAAHDVVWDVLDAGKEAEHGKVFRDGNIGVTDLRIEEVTDDEGQ